MSEIDERVCAIVVTFNRKKLLLECLDAIQGQEYPVSEIIVINNASTDGTEELLYKQGYIHQLPSKYLSETWQKSFNVDGILLTYVRMNENLGGAGGFHEGMKIGHEKGYDWLWLMDDDGRPDSFCLINLLKHKDKADFLAPLVVDTATKNDLSFGIYDKVHKKTLTTYDEALNHSVDGLYSDTANPFNGILLSNKLITSIGYPIKEMFIWGDEAEYFARTQSNNFDILTVVDAIHYHPIQKKNKIDIFFKKYSLMYDNNNLKYYCYIRNQAYRYKKYNKYALFPSFIKHFWMYLITRKLDVKGFLFYFNAFKDGINENFCNHKQFLRK